tara:strand:- start:982 stop:1263 length:282 start_codon:yes stop_codon:yes gene_type:complete
MVSGKVSKEKSDLTTLCFSQIEKMEQVTDSIGNPAALLVERIFWLGLGAFLGLAIVTSLLRGLKERTKKRTPFTPDQLENLAKKAIQQSSDSN